MVVKTEGECPNHGCDAPFKMEIDADMSDTYQQIFEKALEQYPIKLYCQECEEMVEPDMEIMVN